MLPGGSGGLLMIFTKKEELRPVSYMGWGTHQGELFEGWFHGWVQET